MTVHSAERSWLFKCVLDDSEILFCVVAGIFLLLHSMFKALALEEIRCEQKVSDSSIFPYELVMIKLVSGA